jgi:[ribosomal protein S5]-alanine N-acetyltransferase
MAAACWTLGLPRLSGSFVDVREVVPDDASALFELLSDPAVTQHLSGPPGSIDAFVGFIRWAIDQRSAAQSVTFGIVPSGLHAAVGIVQVRALEPSWFAAEWGFAIGAAFWGTGVFNEAADLVAGFAFNHLRVDRLEARAAVANARANGALQKMGAAAEVALTRSFRRSSGAYDEQLLWALRAEDWRQRGLFRGERFSSDTAKERIAFAVASVQEQLAKQRPSTAMATDAAAPYPFLVTRDRRSDAE